MKPSKDWLVPVVLSVIGGLLTLIPYWYANSLVNPGFEFTGFLLNPWDGFTYLAKMQQGVGSGWGFQLAYTADPGPETYLYLYYLFLGKIASISGLNFLITYHGARFLAAVSMFFLSYVFYRRVLPTYRLRLFALLLTILGSGLGWLPLLLFGIETSDIAIPESIPFLVAYSNPHFPLAAASLLGSMISVLADDKDVRLRSGAAFAFGTLLAIVLPFSVLSLVAVLIVWMVWEWYLSGERNLIRYLKIHRRDRTIVIFWLFLSMVPWLIYDAWIASFHPVISAWTAQNITPSPPLWHYLVGYGLLIGLALVGLVRERGTYTSSRRLLITWLLVGALLLYAPIGLQRRLNLGLYFPLAALAAYGLGSIATRKRSFWTAAMILLILTIPTNLLIVGAGIYGVVNDEPIVLHNSDDVAAYRWIQENLPEESLILTSPVNGNRLPAFADVRVLFGHPFETPNADVNRELVLSYFRGTRPTEEVLGELQNLGVSYVYFGEHEKQIGTPRWIEDLPVIVELGDVVIFEVQP